MRLVFVATAAEAGEARPETLTVVLDPAWSPDPRDRADLVPVRRAVSAVLDRVDLADEALSRLDAWASAVDMPSRLSVDGFSYWYRLRESMWEWLQERLLWRAVIGELAGGSWVSEVLLPEGEGALADVARCLTGPGGTVVVGGRAGPPGRWEAETGTVDARRSQGPIGRLAGWRGRRRARAESDRWAREIERRVRAVAASGPRKVLVLSHMGLRQAVSGRPDALPVDPNLGVVVDRLRSMDRLAAIVGLGLDQRAAADRATLETDPLLLPASLLYTRWRDPGVEPEPALTGLAEWPESDRGRPLEVEGIDLGRALSEAIRSAASSEIPGALRQSSRIQRAISELRPGAILMTHEGIRTTWLVAAQRAGIPTFAVQHGILYPRHPGYSGERQAGRVLPTRTFVYGPFERDTLVEYCGYLPEEVIVSGSPRLDLDRAAVGHGDADDPVREADREAVRRDLGVAQPDRMLVVSTTFLPIVRDFHLVSMLARVIGGPLPGVHVVFKQHPGERDEGPYRRLLVGLARAGGYDPPSVTVVRDIDLYRVLRAADAHLGLQSTVLTDAVVVGVPNLIAVGQAAPDLLGYAAAGVARPVRDVADVRAALASPVVADARTRRAFLERHFRPGDAGDRITAELVGWLA